MEDKRKRRCYNCNHKSDSFKIGNLTHLCCLNKNLYPDEQMESGEITPWDTLKVFSESCKEHQFKNK